MRIACMPVRIVWERRRLGEALMRKPMSDPNA